MKKTGHKLDLLGTSTSLLCAVHCAVLPLFLSSGLIGSHSILAHPLFEAMVIVATLCFVYYSIWRPYMRDANNLLPVILSVIGFILVLAHHTFSTYGTFIVVCGSILIATAHIYNLKSDSHTHKEGQFQG